MATINNLLLKAIVKKVYIAVTGKLINLVYITCRDVHPKYLLFIAGCAVPAADLYLENDMACQDDGHYGAGLVYGAYAGGEWIDQQSPGGAVYSG